VGFVFVGVPLPASPVPAVDSAAPLGEAWEASVASKDAADQVLIARSAPEDERLAKLIRALRYDERVAVVSGPRPVTATALIHYVLGHTATSLGIDDHLWLAQALPRYIVTRGVVSSVSQFEHAQTSMVQHLLSLLPWTRFAVDVTAGTVTSLRKASTAPVEDASVVTTGSVGMDPSLLVPAEGTPVMLDVPPAGLTDFWRSRQVAERSYLLGDPRAVVAQILDVEGHPCPNCDHRIRVLVCPFCGICLTPAERSRS
jgi:hypothetical protein